MLTFNNCTVKDTDGVFSVEGGVVVVSGDSPNATVRIAERDKMAGKFRTVDRILNATVNGNGKNWKIEGDSEQLRSEVGTDDARIVLNMVAKAGCQGCR